MTMTQDCHLTATSRTGTGRPPAHGAPAPVADRARRILVQPPALLADQLQHARRLAALFVPTGV
ncbi:hypothetical protein OG875_17580 [Streptomyces sp. NBC_01498]|uniref:hypothetical protein n=1 Tax=Streptomyces sp. NBC_01498 TaxID=2975870 RepID=UPI002E7AE5F8|nr:hypothetical protein [Streptomyces sp. NBC_01498]WTL26238.1 hypothetical protein OG875_17580 [Streptomyces sp. NBC_01498]